MNLELEEIEFEMIEVILDFLQQISSMVEWKSEMSLLWGETHAFSIPFAR